MSHGVEIVAAQTRSVRAVRSFCIHIFQPRDVVGIKDWPDQSTGIHYLTPWQL